MIRKYSPKKIAAWVFLLILFIFLPLWLATPRFQEWAGGRLPLYFSGAFYLLLLGYIAYKWKWFCINDRLGSLVFIPVGAVLNLFWLWALA